jgi:peroxiredoxin family protein
VGDDVERMTIVCWSGELDKVWPQYILATTGAAYGMQVTMFCTFWGLFPLKRPEVKVTGDNWMTKAMGADEQRAPQPPQLRRRRPEDDAQPSRSATRSRPPRSSSAWRASSA